MRIAVCGLVLAWLIALSGYDIRQRRLPNLLTLPGALVILIGATVMGRGCAALAGAAALTGLYLVVHLADPTAMGAGDVKLALALGGLTGSFGAATWFMAALAAPLLTALIGVTGRLGGTRAVALPHGPSMCLTAAASAVLALL